MTIVVAACRTSAPMPMPARALSGARSADATTARSAPGSPIDMPAWRPERIAWVAPNETAATSAPTAVNTAVTTATLAATTEPRAGTAANVVRISPVPYSPTIVIAPTLPAASMTTAWALFVNASWRGSK